MTIYQGIGRAFAVAIVIASCRKQGSADRGRAAAGTTSEAKPDVKPTAEHEDMPMSDPTNKDAPIHRAPPPDTTPAEDTARYVGWMKKRGTPVADKPREDVNLRVGDWGFFDHGGGPGQFADRAGLDHAGHVITGPEAGDWQSFLVTNGLDAETAMARFAWLLKGQAVDPTTPSKIGHKDKLTAPTLNRATDGTITLRGWIVFPPNLREPERITLTAQPSGAKLVREPAAKL